MRRFEVSHRDHDLPSVGHRVALIGPAETLAWPSLCPNCGQMASDRINIQKVFRRKTRRTPWRYYVTAIEVPFCGGCAARHQTLVEPPRAFDGWLAVFKSPLLIPLVGSCVMGGLFFRPLLEMMNDPNGRWIALALFAFLAAIAGSSIVGAWRANHPYRVPGSTDVSRAFDYSDNLGSIVTGTRRVFAIRNSAFAEAFTGANRGRLWTDEIRGRDRRRTTIFAVCVLLAVVVAWAFAKLSGASR
jgi:hypothetical protein